MANTLTKVSLRNVAAHKLRLALTVLAVVPVSYTHLTLPTKA